MASFDDHHGIPQDNAVYATAEYWEQRYKNDKGSYDWFKTWKDLKDTLAPHFNTTDKILQLGCGNSTLSSDMYDDGFEQIVNIDISESVIARMAEENKDRAQMECESQRSQGRCWML
eukprot:TRINITY_DN11713_c0_g1_i1.p1 TRINITY_DN11713_c0_g1~~TRINITY_DN11713_c0_g1_i1.p1  ORF type:complete len:128 (+),score=27.59 TRINITY_DN11713_c0_g1_i1:35-385(+)